MSSDETNNGIKKKTVSGLIWRFAERCGAQGVSFIVSVVLARLLEPEAYGTIALITVFTNILQVFVDSGMGNALIQKKDADELDFSSVFYYNIVICIVLYIVLFFASPYIASFYNDPELTGPLRALGLTLIIAGAKNIQQAYVSKNMMFKKFFFSTLGGTICAAVVGITMAYMGYGVWALVAQQILNAFIDMIILFFTVRWHPKKMFSFERLKGLFSYGWKLLLSSLINTIYQDIRQLVIGKMYSSTDLAYYNEGRKVPNLVVTNINSSIDSVLLPAMSNVQDDVDRVKNMTRRSIKLSSYIMWPMMLGLVAVAEPLVRILLTEKWMPSVPYLRIFCIILAFEPIQTANLNAIKAIGRSDIYLRLEVIKKSIGFLILLCAMNFGVLAIAGSLLVYNVIAQVANSWPNKKLIKYSYGEQLKDIFPFILMACVMAFPVYLITFLPLGDFITLVLQVIVGVVLYVGMSYAFKIESFFYVLNMIKGFLLHKR